MNKEVLFKKSDYWMGKTTLDIRTYSFSLSIVVPPPNNVHNSRAVLPSMLKLYSSGLTLPQHNTLNPLNPGA